MRGVRRPHGLITLQATDNLADRPAGDILHGAQLLASVPKNRE